MKSRIVIIVLSALFCISLTIFSYHFVNSTMTRLDGMREETVRLINESDIEGAENKISEMLFYIESRQDILESLVPHSTLHDISVQLTDVLTSLRIRDMDDFEKAMALFIESVDHFKSHEALSLSNIL